MTAEPLTEPNVAPGRRWPVPPRDGYTVDDLFTLPDLPPHTELIDGSLVFVSPQRDFHPCFRAGGPVLQGRGECPLPRSGAGKAESPSGRFGVTEGVVLRSTSSRWR
jgi:hypothetical protein